MLFDSCVVTHVLFALLHIILYYTIGLILKAALPRSILEVYCAPAPVEPTYAASAAEAQLQDNWQEQQKKQKTIGKESLLPLRCRSSPTMSMSMRSMPKLVPLRRQLGALCRECLNMVLHGAHGMLAFEL